MEEFDELKRKITEDPNSFIILLGAGASIPAGLPSWAGLKDTLCESLADIFEDEKEYEQKIDEINKSRSPWTMFSKLQSCMGQHRYEKVIVQTLDPNNLTTPSIYHKLWKLNPAGIIDFNIDRLAINAYSELFSTAVDYATSKEPHKYKNYPLAYNKFVFFPHGIVSDSSSWIFTQRECSKLYSDQDYKNIMGTLFNSKNLLIIGFNPDEWNFLKLLHDVGITRKINGFHNYYLCPDASNQKRKDLGDYGISVISYHPSSPAHEELSQLLDSILSFRSTDEILPSVYSGQKYSESDIPTADNCYKFSISELRRILNGVIASIIPSDQIPTSDQIKKLESFYNTYIVQLHRAWLVDPRSEDTNTVYHYKTLRFIGNGAFGSVYEAEAPDGQRYALKVLLPDVKDKITYLSCFRRGIRSMRILTEKGIPGMVRIHDSYEVPACIVMDMVDGITLREAIDKKYLTSLEVKMSILKKIASIIHQAHQLEERILHRDLKPENIMLEYCYSASDFEDLHSIPVVKILDFDLSWHRGATEKTVMFGAISQGFMAPEQTDTSTDKSLSRNTSVDVYSIGMLSYYVLTGNNPMPNESMFKSFPEKVYSSISSSYKYAWKCLPAYLSDTIINATVQSQLARISMDTFIKNMDVATNMHLSNTISNTHPLILLELVKRIDNMGEPIVSDFGRTIQVDYVSLSKRIKLATTSIRSKVVLNATIERYTSNYDHRDGITKYFKGMSDRAVAKVNKNLFKQTSSDISNANIIINLSAELPDPVTLDYIESLAQNLREVRQALD